MIRGIDAGGKSSVAGWLNKFARLAGEIDRRTDKPFTPDKRTIIDHGSNFRVEGASVVFDVGGETYRFNPQSGRWNEVDSPETDLDDDLTVRRL